MSAAPDRLIDPFGRRVDYLRVSVTDRCNLRCTYCMSETMRFAPRSALLSLEEIDRICAAFVRHGVRHLRLTGGEPLVRGDILALAGRLSRHLAPQESENGALDELTMTTNGVRLRQHAAGLAQAGIRRINVSLDSLDRATFARIARQDCLDKVLDGIAAAQDCGIRIKINTVALKRDNKDEIADLIAWAHAGGMDITLIETMPLGVVDEDRTDQFLSLKNVRRDLEAHWTLADLAMRSGGPARYVRIAETGGKLGFITPLSQNFCGDCRRLRLTATGRLYMCLGQEDAVDLRGIDSGTDLDAAIVRAVAAKPESHEFSLPVRGAVPASARHMSLTGG